MIRPYSNTHFEAALMSGVPAIKAQIFAALSETIYATKILEAIHYDDEKAFLTAALSRILYEQGEFIEDLPPDHVRVLKDLNRSAADDTLPDHDLLAFRAALTLSQQEVRSALHVLGARFSVAMGWNVSPDQIVIDPVSKAQTCHQPRSSTLYTIRIFAHGFEAPSITLEVNPDKLRFVLLNSRSQEISQAVNPFQDHEDLHDLLKWVGPESTDFFAGPTPLRIKLGVLSSPHTIVQLIDTIAKRDIDFLDEAQDIREATSLLLLRYGVTDPYSEQPLLGSILLPAAWAPDTSYWPETAQFLLEHPEAAANRISFVANTRLLCQHAGIPAPDFAHCQLPSPRAIIANQNAGLPYDPSNSMEM